MLLSMSCTLSLGPGTGSRVPAGEELGGGQFGVEPAGRHQLSVGPRRRQPAAVEDQDPVGQRDRGQPVRDHQHGGRVGDAGDGVAQCRLVSGVEL